jgi:Na+/H+ antiporter NhaC
MIIGGPIKTHPREEGASSPLLPNLPLPFYLFFHCFICFFFFLMFFSHMQQLQPILSARQGAMQLCRPSPPECTNANQYSSSPLLRLLFFMVVFLVLFVLNNSFFLFLFLFLSVLLRSALVSDLQGK